MTDVICKAAALACLFAVSPAAPAQDLSPLREHHVWLPMTGVTDAQMTDARAAGYDTILLKVHPPLPPHDKDIDFAPTDKRIKQATDRGFKVIAAILGWVGLGNGEFWDTDVGGERIPNRLDPFWPEAMQRLEAYFARIIDRYKTNPDVVAFAPTWGIYGEAGFTRWTAGRSTHALARFNEWRKRSGLSALPKLPTRAGGPNTEFSRFIRFRFLYVQEQFDGMAKRLKQRAGGLPVGMWQEMYPVAGYLWNMVEVPSADFALYESAFPYQTTHHPEKCLAETMGFRYRCNSAEDYRNYYLPLLARKRGEGQRFMGCQLSNHYAGNYGWPVEKARRIGFDRWEDEFSPHLKKLLDAPLETPMRDVLLVFPTYAAAALSDDPVHTAEAKLVDILLRMYGCQMVRYDSVRLDRLSVARMNRFRLIVVPCAAYLIPATYGKLQRTTATVLLMGCFGQSFDARFTPFGKQAELDGLILEYAKRRAGNVRIAANHPLTKDLHGLLGGLPVCLPADESFRYARSGNETNVLLRCGNWPVLSTRADGRLVLLHGHPFAGTAYDENRKPLVLLSGSKDASANEHDPWGPYSSKNPQNAFARALMRNILDHAGVAYRIPNPTPRRPVRFLGDHLETASISANILYNNTSKTQTVTVRTPYQPLGFSSKRVGDRYETCVPVPPFSYVALRSAPDEK